MRSGFTTLAVVPAAIAATSVARADEIKVESARSDPSYGPFAGPPACTVIVRGSGFGEKRDAVSVSFDGAPCAVLELGDARLRFQSPPGVAKLGKHAVKIAKSGAHASFDFELVPKRKGGDGPPPPPRITLGALELFQGDAPSARIRGAARLPDGFEVTIALGFKLPQGSATIERFTEHSTTATIRGGAFEARFGPFPGKELLAGEYFVEVGFELDKQTLAARVRAKWPGGAPKTADEIELVKEIHQRAYATSLDERDRVAQAAEHAEHYRELVARSGAVVADAGRAFAGAAKSLERRGTTFDDAAWEKRVVASGEDAKRARADVRFLTAGFALDAEKWEPFATELLAAICALEKKHAAQKAKYLGSRDPEAETLGDELLAIARVLVLRSTAELYAGSGLELPDALRAPKDVLADARRFSRARFERVATRLRERVPPSVEPTGK